MENKSLSKGRSFFERFGYAIIACVLVLGIALAVVLATVDFEGEKPVPVVTTPLVFESPMTDATVLAWYSDSELMYNETLNQWEAHKAIDMTSQDLKVYACLAGKVTNIETSYANGTVVTIAHANGFVSTYKSLGDTLEIAVGDSVQTGDFIGLASASMANTALLNNHIQFSMTKDGNTVDPSSYITFADK